MGRAQQNIGNTIRFARERAQWSQFQLAKALGTSQGTVSRIERGLQVRAAILHKALDILREHIQDDADNIVVPIARSSAPTYKTEQLKAWEVSTFLKAAGLNSGDFALTVDLKIPKQLFIIGDAAGKGIDAAIVATAIQAAFVATIKTLNPEHLNLNGIRLAVESAYRHTIPNWKAGPSVIMGMIDALNNFVEVLNFGMPTIFGIKRGKIEYYKQEPALGMLGSKENPREIIPTRISLSPGESIFLLSDGFLESFEQRNPRNQDSLFSRYLEAASLFTDDSEAVLKNLVEGGAHSNPIYLHANDDMSAMIVLNRKGK